MTNEHPDNPTAAGAEGDSGTEPAEQRTDAMPEDPTTGFDQPAPPPRDAFATSAVPRDGLVRDPYSRLGGIASGIAHRYSWDVALVRIAFVVAALTTFGVAAIVYLIAWLMLPRATVWPPTPVRDARGRFSNREIGIGIVILGFLAFVAGGGGGTGAVLVPLILVGGGVWLLMQHERDAAPRAGDVAGDAATVQSFARPPQPPSMPVAPRSRARKWTIRALVSFVALGFVAALATPLILLMTPAGEGFNFSIGNNEFTLAKYSPNNVSDLPRVINAHEGYIGVDLDSIPAEQFANLEHPITLEIDVAEGDVWIEFPEDLAYSLDVRTESGSISSSDDVIVEAETEPGHVQIDNPDADIEIIITMRGGDISINTTD